MKELPFFIDKYFIKFLNLSLLKLDQKNLFKLADNLKKKYMLKFVFGVKSAPHLHQLLLSHETKPSV